MITKFMSINRKTWGFRYQAFKQFSNLNLNLNLNNFNGSEF